MELESQSFDLDSREALVTADILLTRWGRLRTEEVEDECGVPRVSPSCAGYSSPPTTEELPRTGVTERDVERTVAAMAILSVERWDDYRVLREYYRDNTHQKLGRLDRARARFLLVWRGLY